MNKALVLFLILTGCGSTVDYATQQDVASLRSEIERLDEQNDVFSSTLSEFREAVVTNDKEVLACAWAMSMAYSEDNHLYLASCVEGQQYFCDLIEFAMVCGLGGATILSGL